MRNIIKRLRVKLERHGALNVAFELFYKLLNRAVLTRVLMAVCIQEPLAAEFLACPEKYTAGILGEAQLRRFARDPAYEMSPAFLDRALAKGDQCFAILDGERLAAYGWYSRRPTSIGLGDLEVRFDPRSVYMYKGFTHDDYRGQRLHAIGMTMALRHYLREGCAGLVSYVEATNFDSLKSCFRMGYRAFGSVWIAQLGRRFVTWASPGCAEHAFRVVDGARAQPTSLHTAT